MRRFVVFVSALLVGLLKPAATTLPPPAAPTDDDVVLGGLDGTLRGLVWLVNGCSISTSTYTLAQALFNAFTPDDVCVVAHGEAWNYHDPTLWATMVNRTERWADEAAYLAPFSVLDEVIKQTTELAKKNPHRFPRADCRPFVVAKATTANYATTVATDFDAAPPPFAAVSMARSNLVAFAACLVRDRTLHGLQNNGLALADIGYLVDAATGDRVVVDPADTYADAPYKYAGAAFRENKDAQRAVLDASRLASVLDRIHAADVALKRVILKEMGAPMLVFQSDDLVDFASSPDALRRGAAAWASVLARAQIYVTQENVAKFLTAYAAEHEWGAYACDLSTRIYNLDEVRDALRGTPWAADAYCPGEAGAPEQRYRQRRNDTLHRPP